MARRRAPIWTHWSPDGDRRVSEYIDDGGAGIVLARRWVQRSAKGIWFWKIELRGGDMFDYGDNYTAADAAQKNSDWVLRQSPTRKLFRQEIDKIRREEKADIARELAERKARKRAADRPVAQSSSRQQGFPYAPPVPIIRPRPLQQSLGFQEPTRGRQRSRSRPGRAVPAGSADLPRSRLDTLLGHSRAEVEQGELALRGQQTGFQFRRPKAAVATRPRKQSVASRRAPPSESKPTRARAIYDGRKLRKPIRRLQTGFRSIRAELERLQRDLSAGNPARISDMHLITLSRLVAIYANGLTDFSQAVRGLRVDGSIVRGIIKYVRRAGPVFDRLEAAAESDVYSLNVPNLIGDVGVLLADLATADYWATGIVDSGIVDTGEEF